MEYTGWKAYGLISGFSLLFLLGTFGAVLSVLAK